MKLKAPHIAAGLEIFVLAAIPSWLQSPSDSNLVHSHAAVADLAEAAYVGFRAVKLATDMSKGNPPPPQPPAVPAEKEYYVSECKQNGRWLDGRD